MAVTEEMVIEVMRDMYDPEIPINVVDLGLIYELNVEDDVVKLVMTMTAPGCPYGDQMSVEAKDRITAATGAKEVIIDVVTDPPWRPSMMTEEARKALGLF